MLWEATSDSYLVTAGGRCILVDDLHSMPDFPPLCHLLNCLHKKTPRVTSARPFDCSNIFGNHYHQSEQWHACMHENTECHKLTGVLMQEILSPGGLLPHGFSRTACRVEGHDRGAKRNGHTFSTDATMASRLSLSMSRMSISNFASRGTEFTVLGPISNSPVVPTCPKTPALYFSTLDFQITGFNTLGFLLINDHRYNICGHTVGDIIWAWLLGATRHNLQQCPLRDRHTPGLWVCFICRGLLGV